MHHRDATLVQPTSPFLRAAGRCKYNLHSLVGHNLHYLFYLGYIKEYSHQKHDAYLTAFLIHVSAQFSGASNLRRASPALPHCLQQQQVSSRYTTPYHLELSDILFQIEKSLCSLLLFFKGLLMKTRRGERKFKI